MIYSRKELTEGTGFSCSADSKFKTVSVIVRFIVPLSADAAANALAMTMLGTVSSRFPTVAKMNEELSSLYGMSLGTFIRKRGDVQILGLSASCICSRFTIDGEDTEGSMAELLRDCLFSPSAENGEFESTVFEICRREILDRIDSELNDKRSYAAARLSETAFCGEPSASSSCGTREQAESVTPKAAYEAYRKLLETAPVEIYVCAPEGDPGFEKMFRESFSALDRSCTAPVFRSKSPLKPETKEVSEEMDVRQCRMFMCFKSDSDDIFALKMLSHILGGTPVSKLFVNVRERLSLCYYCSSGFEPSKNTLVIDSGVDRDKLEKAREEIMNQISAVINGDITDEEVENVFLMLENRFATVGDTPSSVGSWYFERFCEGSSSSPEEQLMDYRKVTKARIVNAAQSLGLDCVYTMLSREADQ